MRNPTVDDGQSRLFGVGPSEFEARAKGKKAVYVNKANPTGLWWKEWTQIFQMQSSNLGYLKVTNNG